MKNKKNLLIAIAAVLVIAIIIAVSVVKAQEAKEQARREAEEAQHKIDIATMVVLPYAQLYGFDDMVCNAADFPTTGAPSAVFTSEKFGQASDEEKLAFLSDVEYYSEQVPYDSSDRLINRVVNYGLDIYVISGAYSYAEWVWDGLSQLRRAEAEDAYSTSAYSPYKEVLFSMKTLHSADVEASLDAALHSDDSSGGKGCKRCGETGVPLTAGGYCKVCVDCYYTDYYVGLDGQVYADRPY